MKAFGLAALAFALTVTGALAADSFEKSLARLDPSARLDQVCDLAAMKAIAKDPNRYRPDRAIGNALVSTRIDQDTVEAKGAAFRSRGKWYQFSFTCETSPDHMKVLSFNYRIGDAIPEEKWESYGLWK